VTAVCAVLHPEWFEFQPAKVAVELRGTVARGLTLVEADPFFNRVPTGSTVSIAVDSRAELVLDLFRTRVLARSGQQEEGAA
jgi:inosine-uridine nucleoside N-ribohydrolase